MDVNSHDFRAPSLPQKRYRDRQSKYNSFISFDVSPGSLSQPHHDLFHESLNPDPQFLLPAIPADAPVQCLTPKQLYLAAQLYPVPPKLHHASKDKFTRRGKTIKWETRIERTRNLRRVILEKRRGAWKDDKDEVLALGKLFETCVAVRHWEDEQEWWDRVSDRQLWEVLPEEWRERKSPWECVVEEAEERWRVGDWDLVCSNRDSESDLGEEDGFVLVE